MPKPPDPVLSEGRDQARDVPVVLKTQWVEMLYSEIKQIHNKLEELATAQIAIATLCGDRTSGMNGTQKDYFPLHNDGSPPSSLQGDDRNNSNGSRRNSGLSLAPTKRGSRLSHRVSRQEMEEHGEHAASKMAMQRMCSSKSQIYTADTLASSNAHWVDPDSTLRKKTRKSKRHEVIEFVHSPEKRDKVLDVSMAVLIVLNAIFIGVQMDTGYDFLKWIDIGFTSIFFGELLLNVYLKGPKTHFCGQFRVSNAFDTFLILLDTTQIALGFFIKDIDEKTPPASLFRVVRLTRMVRLLKMCRLNMLQDLIAMASGMTGGISTLFWSVIMLLMFVYISALLFKEFFGKSTYTAHGVNVGVYFRTLPRSMLTVFRCFFGDCNSVDGINLVEMLQLTFGWPASTLFCLLSFFITIGVFNVISAIFVESTMASANAVTAQRKKERLNDGKRWKDGIATLVESLLKAADKIPQGDTLDDNIRSIQSVSIVEDDFDTWIRDPVVTHTLRELDIEDADHKFLFDIVDCDNTGFISVADLVDGLKRLRGDPRRSDIITIDLMVRSLQVQCNEIVEGMRRLAPNTTDDFLRQFSPFSEQS